MLSTKVTLFIFCFIYFIGACNAHTGVEKIEKKYNVKIGIHAIDTTNGNTFSHRQDEQFPFQSTFKFLVCAAILKNIRLDEKVKISASDIVFWSPIIRLNLKKGYMTIAELCAAAMSYSDNGATNLLIKKLGGIKKINSFAKLIGNTSFYLKNIEPYLNSDLKKKHDISTPQDMAKSVKKLIVDNTILTPKHKKMLIAWMLNNTTGYKKIRSGLPLGWHAAEKTGGSSTISNDIGIVWSPACKPIVIAIYTISNTKSNKQQPKSIAAITKLLLHEFSKSNACYDITAFK